MNTILKTALMAATIAGATAFVPSLANAQIGISVGIGTPGYGAPAYGPCDPNYAPCTGGYNAYEGDYYYDPIYFDGQWYHGPYRWRMSGNDRVYWIDGAWHRNEWTGGAYPGSMNFRNGGSYRGGRYEGFGDADRINARFHPTNGPNRGARPDAAADRSNMNQDHGSMGQDHPDNGREHQDSQHGDDRQNSSEGPHN
ncbi:MAG: hypothetical protein ABSD74_18790 [Rhizomicrobium sp.]